VICVRELKSSIVPIRTVALGLSRRYHLAKKMDVNRTSMLNSASSAYDFQNNPGPNQHLLLNQLKSKFVKAQSSWNIQIEKLKMLFHQCQAVMFSNHKKQTPSRDIFDAILLIYIGETHLDQEIALKNLMLQFEDCPQEVEFFIPQIAIFFLYGSFDLEEELRDCILQMCEKNISFAYKLHWFIAAFCRVNNRGTTEDPLEVESNIALAEFDGQLVLKGEKSCALLSNPSSNSSNSHFMNQVTMSPFAMASYGAINHSSAESEVELPTIASETKVEDSRRSLSSSLTYPLYLCKIPLSQSFQSQLLFWDALVEISRQLHDISKPNRSLIFKQMLEEINTRFLPSATIHIPLGNSSHRIWKIHSEESSIFSTKERTPILICFEVVHYAQPKR
jgi:hypothetical protein